MNPLVNLKTLVLVGCAVIAFTSPLFGEDVEQPHGSILYLEVSSKIASSLFLSAEH